MKNTERWNNYVDNCHKSSDYVAYNVSWQNFVNFFQDLFATAFVKRGS